MPFDVAAQQAQDGCPLLSDTITQVCALSSGNAHGASSLCRHAQETQARQGPECKVLETFMDGGGQICLATIGSSACGVLRTHVPTAADIEAFEASPTHATLELQRRLADELSLAHAPWVSTHNSFNAVAYEPTLSGMDPNQYYSLTDQFRMGVREIELDPHWMPSVQAGGAMAPVICHGRPPEEGHVGCTHEALLEDRLHEIRAWLDSPASGGDVILIEINDRIGAPAGYDATAATLQATLGDLIFRPGDSGQSCSDGLPLEVSRSDVRAAGKRVLLTADSCGSGGAYAALVHHHGPRENGGNPDGTDCIHPAATYASNMVRFHEDSTMVDAVVSGHESRFSAQEVQRLDRCGANLLSLDRIHPDDPRLAALAWFWDMDSFAQGACAAHMLRGQHIATDCQRRAPFACRAPSGWEFTAHADQWTEGTTACAAMGASFDVPRTAADNEALKQAKSAAGVLATWVNLYQTDQWVSS